MQASAMKCSLSFTHTIILLIFFYFCSPLPSSANALQPFLTPIHKDSSTNLYSLSANLKTPLQPTNLHLDLGASLTWVDCTRRYKSSTYRHVLYNASLCIELDPRIYGNCFKKPGPACFNDSCEFFPENSVTREVAIGVILVDSLALPTTDGRNPGKPGQLSDFVFSCGTTKLLRGLAKGVTGLAALGRFNFSLPAQLSRAFSSPLVFAVCLPSTPTANGVAIFNSPGPYYFLPGIELSKSLIYTPLLLNPYFGTVITYDRPSDEYFIGVTAIKVNGKSVALNKTLLAINQEDGFGGTKITTSTQYTVLHTSIFNAFTEAFKKESAALKLTLITPVKPFSLCYEADKVPSTRVGPAVPTIDLVLQSESVFWRIFGANSMVNIKGGNGVNALCLGFVDGGAEPRTSIVMGGLQIEDNLLQFDLVSNRLGFSSSVLFRNTTCSNFNFTTNNI